MVKNIVKTEQIAYKILMEPWITEAATQLAEMNKYVFRVAPKASKIQIKKSVEELYGVTVLSVKTINIHSKTRIRGKVAGKKSGFKKAIVSLKEGDSINIYQEK